MSDRFAVTGLQTAVESTPGETVAALFDGAASPSTRAKLYYVAFSAGGTMADQLQAVQLQRITGVGTEGAGVTPAKLDLGGPTGDFDGAEDHSAEPTFTAATELWEQDVHVRALAQLQLQPDGNIWLPATQNAGVAVRSFSSNYTGTAHCTFHYEE